MGAVENISVQDLHAEANKALSSAQQVKDQALRFIKNKCQGDNDRLSAKKLDEHQLVSYDMAFIAAELTGAEAVLHHAQRVRDARDASDLQLEERLAVVFVAETLNNMRARLGSRLAEFGLNTAAMASFDSGEIRAFCDEQLSTVSLAELGQQMLSLDGYCGDPLLSEDAEIMRGAFAKLASDVVAPLAEEIHRQDLMIPDEILDSLKEMGCFGLSIPEQYGGLQPDDREDNMGMIVVTEELSRGSLAAAGSLITRPEILSKALLAGGTETQKQHWLPQLASGDVYCAVAITEPDYGSDVAGIMLKATRVEGGWELNGNKTWCTFGGKAGVLLVLARTDADLSLGHKGLTMFLVEKPSSDGHEFSYTQEGGGTMTGKAIATAGYRGMHSFDVFFDKVFVADKNVLGEEDGLGKGFYHTMVGFAGGRIQTAARANGLMNAAFGCAISYAKERKVFGQPIGDYQLTAVKLARMGALLSASRQFTYQVARLMDEGKGQMEASLVKLYSCKTAQWLCSEALQIHGGMGYAEETPVSRYWIDSRVLSIFEGAEETLALKVIAKSLLESA